MVRELEQWAHELDEHLVHDHGLAIGVEHGSTQRSAVKQRGLLRVESGNVWPSASSGHDARRREVPEHWSGFQTTRVIGTEEYLWIADFF